MLITCPTVHVDFFLAVLQLRFWLLIDMAKF